MISLQRQVESLQQKYAGFSGILHSVFMPAERDDSALVVTGHVRVRSTPEFEAPTASDGKGPYE